MEVYQVCINENIRISRIKEADFTARRPATDPELYLQNWRMLLFAQYSRIGLRQSDTDEFRFNIRSLGGIQRGYRWQGECYTPFSFSVRTPYSIIISCVATTHLRVWAASRHPSVLVQCFHLPISHSQCYCITLYSIYPLEFWSFSLPLARTPLE